MNEIKMSGCGEETAVSSGIRIREAAVDDAARLLEIYAFYVEKTAITFEYDVPSLEEFRGRIAHIKERYPYLVIERNGVIEGYAYAGVFKDRAAYDRSCEMTIYLEEALRGTRGSAEGAGNAESVRLHRISGCAGRVSGLQQRAVPRTSGIQNGRHFPPVRIQIRTVVQYDLDGEDDRRAQVTRPGK